jgi:Cd2+/Zn2+-exporting ATPase
MQESNEDIDLEKKSVYRVQGLTCTNCAAQFEGNVKEINGVQNAQINFGASKLTVVGDASIEQLEKAGAFDGIKVYPEKQRLVLEKVPFWRKKANITTAVSALLLLIGIVLEQTAGESNLLTVLVFGASILIGGYNLFIKGLRNLSRFRFDMNTLMTVAIIGAVVIGEWEEGAIVVLLFALSEALESYSMNKARQSIGALMGVAPKEATILRGKTEYQVAVEDIQIGNIMVIKPGQKIAMDGQVISGHSSVNQATITGESIPVAKVEGDEVFAGTINEEGLLHVKVTKHVEDTTISKIIHLVEEAQAEKAPSQAFVDKFAKYYTPAIMLIALGTVLIPPLFFNGDWDKWIYEGLALLVVGCPCALVVSTPVAIVTAIGNAARNGVLIKGGIHLEETGAIKAIAFDKTGTLTKGLPEVTDIVNVSNQNTNDLLAVAASIEKGSRHPLASAILRKADSEGIQFDDWSVTDFSSITGKGAKGTINGTTYYIGNPKLFNDIGANISGDVTNKIQSLQEQGKTVMVLGTEQEALFLIAVADSVRKSSQDVIRKLHEVGVTKTIMLTGDNKATAEAIGKEIGIGEVKAELMPQDKLKAIKELQTSYGKVAMVGDGVNDAPALATATVGIAMGGAGTDTALETADVALMGDDLSKLPYTIKLSRKTLSVIKQNITFSLVIKLIAVLLVLPGMLTLWIAILADMGATLLVILNSLRLARLKE